MEEFTIHVRGSNIILKVLIFFFFFYKIRLCQVVSLYNFEYALLFRRPQTLKDFALHQSRTHQI